MTTRNDITVDFASSPRVAEVASPSTELSAQDTVDTLRVEEDSFRGMSEPKLLDAFGKQDLGGGVKVGITTELQNTQLAFEGRTTPAQTGTVTTDSSTPLAGRIELIDSSATFVSNNVARGSLVINFTDQSIAEVYRVDSETQLTTKTLVNGIDNSFDIGDVYHVFNIEQCEVSGGNVVAKDDIGGTLSAVIPTAFTQIKVTAASSATQSESTSIQHSSYENVVTVDVTSVYSGTTFPIGTPLQPVNNLADAIAISDERGFDTLKIVGNITLDATAQVTGMTIIGQNQLKSLIVIESAADVYECIFKDCTLRGTLDGRNILEDCRVTDINYLNGYVRTCLIQPGTIYLGGGVDAHFLDCWTEVNGFVPIIDMGGSGQDVNLGGYKGAIEIRNLSDPSNKAVMNFTSGKAVVHSSITAGDITINGVGTHSHTQTGTEVVDVDGLVNRSTISSAVWDESAEFHNITGSMAGELSRIPKTVSDTYYVDNINGSNSNSGRHSDYAWETLAYAFANISDGDTIIVARSTYVEEGLELSNNAVRVLAGLGTSIVSSAGSALTVSGDNNFIEFLGCTPSSPQIGFNLTGSANLLENCTAVACLIGFNIVGARNALVKSRAFVNIMSGFNLQNNFITLYECISNGMTVFPSRGYYLSTSSADNCSVVTCSSQGAAIAGFEVVSGANNNIFGDCYSGAGDGAKIDNGTDNSFFGGSFNVITEDVANTVWDALQENHNASGTMGYLQGLLSSGVISKPKILPGD